MDKIYEIKSFIGKSYILKSIEGNKYQLINGRVTLCIVENKEITLGGLWDYSPHNKRLVTMFLKQFAGITTNSKELQKGIKTGNVIYEESLV